MSQQLKRQPPDPRGRLDIAAYRLAAEHLLPRLEQKTGLAGLADILKPIAESVCSDLFPGKSIFSKSRRPLC